MLIFPFTPAEDWESGLKPEARDALLETTRKAERKWAWRCAQAFSFLCWILLGGILIGLAASHVL